MNLSGPFIRRPVATTLVMLGIFAFGLMAFRYLPVSDLPNVDFPTIQVSATLPGASPETMASSVATPLEREFSTIAGLDSMTSSSAQGATSITLQFSLSRDLDAAAQDVQAAIARASRLLPADMPSPPSYRKVNPADQPILYIALTSPTLPMYTLDEYGETMMAQRISTVSGVAQVQVYGSQKYAVRIQVDPKALANRSLGIDEVAQAIRNGNVNLPTGTLFGAHTAFTVEARGQLTDAKAYEPLIVAYRNGSPVRLRDIGRIYDSVENDKTAAWLVDQRSLVLAIQRQPGTNTVEVSRAVRELLPTFRTQLPASVDLVVLFDRSVSIQDSVRDVELTLLVALILVILVIFLFLRNLPATIIPGLALPMSLVGTFATMYVLGFSLDNLSLLALTLSVGFVVDDAIVMLENVVRHMEMGKAPYPAAVDGSREVSFTILSMTLSLAAVFLPVLFMAGILGRLFKEFAVTIGMAVLISGFVSLTLTPMLCSRFLRQPGEIRHGRLFRLSERGFQRMLGAYEAGLRWSLRHRLTLLVATCVVQVATVYLFIVIPKGFLPTEDIGQIFAFTEAAEGISWDAMSKLQQRAGAIIRENPYVERFFSTAGSRGGISSSNTGILFMRLKPRGERPSADEIIAQLRPKLAELPGINVYPQVPQPIRIGGQLTKSQYQFTLQSPDTDELYHYAPILEAKLREIPALQDVTTDLQLKNPQVEVDIARDRASSLGVTAEQIEDALFSAYGSRQVSTIFAPNNTYDVILELEDRYQRDPSALGLLYVRSESGQLVPLETLANLRRTLGPLTVNHSGQLAAVTLSFNLRPGYSLSEAVSTVNDAARGTLPATISTSFQGTAQAFQSSLQGLGVLLLVTVLVIYMVLGILYESFIHPVTILSALPFAGFGAVATLMLFGEDLNIYSFVGVIMLVGLVKKNGIIMIDFAIEAERREHKSATDAIYDACVVRFRPIMMTTMAALFGTLPIALGLGAGAESRRPLGLAVVGGLLFSQLLTLFVTPVIYTYLDQFQTWVGRKVPLFGRRGEMPGEGHGETARA